MDADCPRTRVNIAGRFTLEAMAASKVRPVSDKVYPFADHAEAYRRLESGNHIGKVIIDMAA